jgi:hypothetical protein
MMALRSPLSTKLPVLGTLAAAALLSACVADGPSGPAPIASAPVGFDGEWLSTDGVAISRFNGGRFDTVATDTGNTLADGNYRLVNDRTAEITVFSRLRQTTSNVNCALATTNQLNCTTSTGQNFVLTRRSAAPIG